MDNNHFQMNCVLDMSVMPWFHQVKWTEQLIEISQWSMGVWRPHRWSRQFALFFIFFLVSTILSYCWIPCQKGTSQLWTGFCSTIQLWIYPPQIHPNPRSPDIVRGVASVPICHWGLPGARQLKRAWFKDNRCGKWAGTHLRSKALDFLSVQRPTCWDLLLYYFQRWYSRFWLCLTHTNVHTCQQHRFRRSSWAYIVSTCTAAETASLRLNMEQRAGHVAFSELVTGFIAICTTGGFHPPGRSLETINPTT